jgi:ADP-ribose pyrophosphatase
MEQLKEKALDCKTVFEGRLLKVRLDTVKLYDGTISTREVVEHPGAVAVIAITADNKLVLVRQYRRPMDEILLEIPAGVPNPGESGEAAALRELEEETGYRAGRIEKLFEGYASPGYSNELIQFFLAGDLKKYAPKTDEDERIEVELHDLGQGLDLIKAGKIRDNKSIIGMFVADQIASINNNGRKN